jgi:hypothetical protein
MYVVILRRIKSDIYDLLIFVDILYVEEPHQWCYGWCTHLEWSVVGLCPDRVKPKTIKLIFVASPLDM